MGADRLLPLISAAFVLGVAGAALLIAGRRRLPADFVGRVKADALLAMLRALLVVLAGLGLALVGRATRLSLLGELGQWLAIGLIVLGGVALSARIALYLLRIKPELDQLPTAVVSRPARPRPSPSLERTNHEGY